MRRKQLTINIKVIKHFTIVINNTIQMNGGQYIEHMNNYQGKEDEKCLDKE